MSVVYRNMCGSVTWLSYDRNCSHVLVGWQSHNSHMMVNDSHTKIMTVELVKWQSHHWHFSDMTVITDSRRRLTSLTFAPAGGGGGARLCGCLFCSLPSFLSFFLGLADGGWGFEEGAAPSTIPGSGSIQRRGGELCVQADNHIHLTTYDVCTYI